MLEKDNSIIDNCDLVDKFIIIDETNKDDVFIEYDGVIALQKLLTLKSNENHAEKLQYISRIGELISIIDENGLSRLPEILNAIITDTDGSKKALCTQFDPLIAFFLKRGEKGYNEIIEYLIPPAYALLSVKNFDIKRKAGNVMTTIANYLNQEDKAKHILPICLNMAHDDHSEDNRIVAIQLIGGLNINFSKELYEKFIALEFLSLGEDPQIKVRREIAKNLANISRMVSSKFFNQRLLPVFYRLCDDPAQEIKISCVEIIIDIANIADTISKQTTLTDKYLHFIKEGPKPVKIAAYKKLGPFIAQLKSLKINEQLIEAYLHMPDNNINGLGQDNEIIIACAYNFPAVVLTLGSSRWPQLNKLFATLLKGEVRVKRPLAYALHEIALIMGEEKRENDLFGYLKSFLADQSDDIRYGVIKNIGLILKSFSMDKHEIMADYICQLQRDDKKWRIRELLASQIGILSSIFTPEIVFQIISPISFKLCCDPVAIVRETACSNIHSLLFNLYDTEHKDMIIENINIFSLAPKYTSRQAFISMCDKLMDKIELFEKYFYNNFIKMGDDKVLNVRLTLSRLLRKKFDERCPMVFNKQILLLMQRLQNDQCKDVRIHVQDLNLPLPQSLRVNSSLKNISSFGVTSPKLKEQNPLKKEIVEEDKITKVLDYDQKDHITKKLRVLDGSNSTNAQSSSNDEINQIQNSEIHLTKEEGLVEQSVTNQIFWRKNEQIK